MQNPRRRTLHAALAALGAMSASALPSAARSAARSAAHAYPPVRRGSPIVFPRDHGAHPEFRIEWWYLTGWLRRLAAAQDGAPAGVQITFFRSRTQHPAANPSRFAPTQVIFAHAALALPERPRLLHAHRASRAGFGFAQASATDTEVAIGSWSLERSADDVYRSRIDDTRFALDLAFRTHAAPLLQGDAGYSRKGPREEQASFYYSRPQLEVTGSVHLDSRAIAIDGLAWLDHEWSSEILDASATGWDWVGLNFDDGSALMAFRIRRRDGGTMWTQARWSRRAGNAWRPIEGGDRDPPVEFEPLRYWTSPHTGARYPVSMRIMVAGRSLRLEPLLDDQELDTRGTSGVVYWEGAVEVFEGAMRVARGYLELTGYAQPVKL